MLKVAHSRDAVVSGIGDISFGFQRNYLSGVCVLALKLSVARTGTNQRR